MKAFLLGAGASKAYDASPSGQRMPIARDFFQTFLGLSASENPWVLLGGVLAYLQQHRGIEDLYGYLQSGIDIEDLHSEIEARQQSAVPRQNQVIADSAFNQLVFLFAATINEIQNGPVSQPHSHLVDALRPGDAVITFNWDTLLDRALAERTEWHPDWGYGAKPQKVFRNGWTSPISRPEQSKAVELIKLHGSTNWLTAYAIRDLTTRKIELTHDLDPSAFNVFVQGDEPYPCHAGRHMPGFQPYSYGYYPPNLDFPGKRAEEGKALVLVQARAPWRPQGTSSEEGLVSMPLIIPPVRHKSYDMFGDLFRRLWTRAEDVLATAELITVIGYSFPKTDIQTDRLFRAAFSRRSSLPEIRIIDPAPDRIVEKFRDELGIPEDHLDIRPTFFTAELAQSL